MGIIGDIFFGSDETSSSQRNEVETRERERSREERTGRTQIDSRTRGTEQSEASSRDVTQSLNNRDIRRLRELITQAGRINRTDPFRDEQRAALANLGAVNTRLLEEATTGGVDVDPIVAAAEQQAENELQRQQTGLAAAGGSGLNTIVAQLGARGGAENAVNIAALRAQLERENRTGDLQALTAAIEGSGAAAEISGRLGQQAIINRTIPYELQANLFGILRGARVRSTRDISETTQRQDRTRQRSVEEIISEIRRRGRREGTEQLAGGTEAQNQPGIFDFIL